MKANPTLKKNFIVFFFLVIAVFVHINVYSQIIVTNSNSNGTYTSLTNSGGAFAALNSTSQANRNITIVINSNVTNEAGTNALTGASGMWSSLTISPGAAAIISGSVANSPPY